MDEEERQFIIKHPKEWFARRSLEKKRMFEDENTRHRDAIHEIYIDFNDRVEDARKILVAEGVLDEDKPFPFDADDVVWADLSVIASIGEN